MHVTAVRALIVFDTNEFVLVVIAGFNIERHHNSEVTATSGLALVECSMYRWLKRPTNSN